MRTLRILLVCVAIGMVLVSSAYAEDNENNVVKVWVEACEAGPHITDVKGMTLYWFTKDTPGKSACEGSCVEKWPVFYRDSITTAGDIEASDFGTITRPDGKKQTTYKGYPLYYYAKDKDPGDTLGNKVGNVWFVIEPSSFPPMK